MTIESIDYKERRKRYVSDQYRLAYLHYDRHISRWKNGKLNMTEFEAEQKASDLGDICQYWKDIIDMLE